MDRPELSEDVLVFLREHIDSYEKLEVLVLLSRYREQFWSADSVCTRLGLRPASAEDALEELCERKILDIRDQGGIREFALRPGDAALEKAVERLLQAYKDQRLEVIQHMNTNAIERIRNSAINTFADAFFLRRRDKDG